MRLLVIVAFAACCAACTDASGARNALIGAGYTAVQTHGFSWWGCGKGDTFATEFTAKGPTGVPVRGVVCSDWFKGATIRTF